MKPEKEIAINVAIIPPKEIQELAIKLNRTAKEKGYLSKELGLKDFIPHITLFMGIVKEKDLEKIKETLNKICSNVISFPVKLTEIIASNTHPDEKSAINVAYSESIQKIHEEITTTLKKYLMNSAEAKHLYKGEETGIGERTKKWLETYTKTSAYEKYWPHITLRCKKVETTDLPKTFIAQRIGLYHSGDGVTCRHKLGEWNLKK